MKKPKKRVRKYGPMAALDVERAMHARKHGTLRSGRSGRKVTSRKQAVAIGLSEARRAGGKVPPGKGPAPKKTKNRSPRPKGKRSRGART
jgi:hypothetical protein